MPTPAEIVEAVRETATLFRLPGLSDVTARFATVPHDPDAAGKWVVAAAVDGQDRFVYATPSTAADTVAVQFCATLERKLNGDHTTSTPRFS